MHRSSPPWLCGAGHWWDVLLLSETDCKSRSARSLPWWLVLTPDYTHEAYLSQDIPHVMPDKSARRPSAGVFHFTFQILTSKAAHTLEITWVISSLYRLFYLKSYRDTILQLRYQCIDTSIYRYTPSQGGVGAVQKVSGPSLPHIFKWNSPYEKPKCIADCQAMGYLSNVGYSWNHPGMFVSISGYPNYQVCQQI